MKQSLFDFLVQCACKMSYKHLTRKLEWLHERDEDEDHDPDQPTGEVLRAVKEAILLKHIKDISGSRESSEKSFNFSGWSHMEGFPGKEGTVVFDTDENVKAAALAWLLAGEEEFSLLFPGTESPDLN